MTPYSDVLLPKITQGIIDRRTGFSFQEIAFQVGVTHYLGTKERQQAIHLLLAVHNVGRFIPALRTGEVTSNPFEFPFHGFLSFQ
jgi:hypothetical protein